MFGYRLIALPYLSQFDKIERSFDQVPSSTNTLCKNRSSNDILCHEKFRLVHVNSVLYLQENFS